VGNLLKFENIDVSKKKLSNIDIGRVSAKKYNCSFDEEFFKI